MGTVARVQVAATAVVIDGAWYSLVALLLARGRSWPPCAAITPAWSEPRPWCWR